MLTPYAIDAFQDIAKGEMHASKRNGAGEILAGDGDRCPRGRSRLERRNPALQFKAAQEIMDREGTLAKVSKSSVQVETKPNTQVDPNVMGNLMSLLASAPRSGDGGLTAAATGGFTMNAEAATKQQITMAEENTTKSLEELDLSNSKPN